MGDHGAAGLPVFRQIGPQGGGGKGGLAPGGKGLQQGKALLKAVLPRRGGLGRRQKAEENVLLAHAPGLCRGQVQAGIAAADRLIQRPFPGQNALQLPPEEGQGGVPVPDEVPGTEGALIHQLYPVPGLHGGISGKMLQQDRSHAFS